MNSTYMTSDPPPTIEGCAYNMKTMFEAKPGSIHWVKCYGTRCDKCRGDKNIYRVCPICGESLLMTDERPYECTCGTILWVCLRGFADPIVTRYITRDLPLATAEDII